MTFALTETALKNLIIEYANAYYDVQYHYSNSASGYCNCAKDWMNALGICPESEFVQDIVNNVYDKKRR